MRQIGQRMNWGVGLLLGFGVFIIGIVSLAVIAMSRDVDLVTEGYYEKELRYQERIHALQRGGDPENALKITEAPTGIVLQFPRHRAAERYSGTIALYRPANRHDDVRYTVALDSLCRQAIPTGRLARGLWRVHVDWVADGTPCFAERVLVLQ